MTAMAITSQVTRTRFSRSSAEIQVTTSADLLTADGLCSLREAVFAARDDTPFQGCSAGAAAGTDTILLDAQT